MILRSAAILSSRPTACGEKLTGWLAERGLSFNQDKTRVVHLTQGFDFLGWNFRRYPSGKLLIKPSRNAVSNHRRKLASEMRKLRGSNAAAVIGTLNPVIRGWTTYHRCMVSSATFSSLANYMWKLTWKWARRSHPNKSRKWVADRYYGRFNPGRTNRWVFGDRDTGAHLRNHDWTQIRRHVTVRGTASPDDRDLAGYWRYRRDKAAIPLDSTAVRLLHNQRSCCPLCGDWLLDPDHLPGSAGEWQHWWHGVTYRHERRAASAPGQQPGTHRATTSLLHTSCQKSLAQRQRHRSTALQPATPQRLARAGC